MVNHATFPITIKSYFNPRRKSGLQEAMDNKDGGFGSIKTGI